MKYMFVRIAEAIYTFGNIIQFLAKNIAITIVSRNKKKKISINAVNVEGRWQMSSDFKINEAILNAKLNGLKVTKKELAKQLWEDSQPKSRTVNMSSLCNRRTRKINIEWVSKIGEATGVDANFLFNIKPKNND